MTALELATKLLTMPADARVMIAFDTNLRMEVDVVEKVSHRYDAEYIDIIVITDKEEWDDRKKWDDTKV